MSGMKIIKTENETSLKVYKRKKMIAFTESKLLLKLYKQNNNLKICDFNRYIRLINSDCSNELKLKLLKVEIMWLKAVAE